MYTPAQGFDDEAHVGLDEDDAPGASNPPGTPGSAVRRDLVRFLDTCSCCLLYFAAALGR